MRILAWFVLVMASGSFTAAAPPDVEAAFVKGEVEFGDGSSLPYRLHRPPAGPDQGPLPLVVFLHGAGERGVDNSGQLRHFPDRWIREPHLGKRHPAVVLAFQCPPRSWWSKVRRNSKDEWVSDPEIFITPELAVVMTKVKELASDPSVDASRIYLTGLSMGGFGSWELLKHHPDLFAAVVPICGGGDVDAAPAIAAGRTPIWNLHGDADRIVVVERSREMVEAVRAAGGRVGHTELPGVGHDSWVWAYGPHGVIDWMFAQRRSDPAGFEDP